MRRGVLVLCLICAAIPAAALDPVQTDGDKYKVLFENDRLRVLEYEDSPGGVTRQHDQPAFVLYAAAPFEREIALPDGKTLRRSFAAGDVMWSDAQTHVDQNVGTTPTHVIMVELKD